MFHIRPNNMRPFALHPLQITDINEPLSENQKAFLSASKKKKEKMREAGQVSLP